MARSRSIRAGVRSGPYRWVRWSAMRFSGVVAIVFKKKSFLLGHWFSWMRLDVAALSIARKLLRGMESAATILFSSPNWIIAETSRSTWGMESRFPYLADLARYGNRGYGKFPLKY